MSAIGVPWASPTVIRLKETSIPPRRRTVGVLVDGALVEHVEDGYVGGVADLGGERLERLARAPDEVHGRALVAKVRATADRCSPPAP